jgi:hypothetical protein
MAALSVDRRLLALGGLLAGVSLALPWGVREEQLLDAELPFAYPVPVGDTTWYFPDSLDVEVAVPVVVRGLEHPARLLAFAAALLVWWAVSRGSRRIAWLGIAVAGAALPIGGTGGAGRVLLAAGLAVVALALVRAAPARTGADEGSAGPDEGRDPQPAAARLR